MKSFHPLSDAIHQVGPIMFGDDWIGHLTKTDAKFLTKYGPKPYGAQVQTIEPCAPRLSRRLDRVLGRDRRMLLQRATVLDWILAAKVLTSRDTYDEPKLKAALAKAKPAAQRGGAPQTARAEVVRTMLSDIYSRRLTSDELAAMPPKVLARRYKHHLVTCVKARKMALAEAARLNL
jgi:hypothetical protein